MSSSTERGSFGHRHRYWNSAGPFVELSKQLTQEFSVLGDYIWKTPRLLDSEREVERKKVQIPRGVKLTDQEERVRVLRIILEFGKIEVDFPRYQAISNFLMATAVYEAGLIKLLLSLRTMLQLERDTAIPAGARALHRALEQILGSGSHLPFFQAVNVALQVRNCFIHANGVLDYVRGGDNLAESIERREHFTDFHLSQSEKHPNMKSYLGVSIGEFGKAIDITNNYSFLTSAYYPEHFASLCQMADEKFEDSSPR